LEGLIFRNDDVNSNTDFDLMNELYHFILSKHPDAIIWSGVTIFSKFNRLGSVYPNPPFKGRPIQSFYDVNRILQYTAAPNNVQLVSHGLWHIDHSKVDRSLQEASILTSCNLLDTDIFVPPFNHYNQDTVEICDINNIELTKLEHGWKSMEHNKFDPKHSLWYFHSWQWSVEKLLDYLS
jgi:hypothetical protein